MTDIQLERRWRLGDLLGSGGFGRVYATVSDDGEEAAVKLIPKVPGGDRELLFEDLGEARNIVPILERGETPDHWVIVMPRADGSLRQHLDAAGGSLAATEVVEIWQDVVNALEDLDGRVVHRDIKPENVLLLDDQWCLADFGIARYAEASTAPDTQKHALSAPYAAPERWRDERATIACDVYATGVMVHEMLVGERPFAGPSTEDFREQHLHAAPAGIEEQPEALRGLIAQCLFKAPETRPRPVDIGARLPSVLNPARPTASRLQKANQAAVARAAARDAARSSARSEAERTSQLLSTAIAALDAISRTLREALVEAAPSAQTEQPSSGWALRLNDARCAFDGVVATPADPWLWEAPAFRVVAHCALAVTVPPGRDDYEGRSHSLWFCDAQTADHYGWFETAFMISPMVPRRGRQDPFALAPGEESAKAVWSGVAEFQVAWPFTRLDLGELDDFVERWSAWFGEAALGQLGHPTRMPEYPPQGTWR